MYLQQGVGLHPLEKHLMLSRDRDRETQHTPTADTGSCLLAHRLPASAQPAPPAKDKADDRGKGKN